MKLIKISWKNTINSAEILQTYYCLAFPVTFTQEILQNMEHKLSLWQNTVCSVLKFTQALNILHDRWPQWLWHFACLHTIAQNVLDSTQFFDYCTQKRKISCSCPNLTKLCNFNLFFCATFLIRLFWLRKEFFFRKSVYPLTYYNNKKISRGPFNKNRSHILSSAFSSWSRH